MFGKSGKWAEAQLEILAELGLIEIEEMDAEKQPDDYSGILVTPIPDAIREVEPEAYCPEPEAQKESLRIKAAWSEESMLEAQVASERCRKMMLEGRWTP